MPKLYIDEFVGISNRLETLPLAFAIRKAYGHEIVLDWHELDSFAVEDTSYRRIGILQKLGALRLRNCDRALFDTLAGREIRKSTRDLRPLARQACRGGARPAR